MVVIYVSIKNDGISTSSPFIRRAFIFYSSSLNNIHGVIVHPRRSVPPASWPWPCSTAFLTQTTFTDHCSPKKIRSPPTRHHSPYVVGRQLQIGRHDNGRRSRSGLHPHGHQECTFSQAQEHPLECDMLRLSGHASHVGIGDVRGVPLFGLQRIASTAGRARHVRAVRRP